MFAVILLKMNSLNFQTNSAGQSLRPSKESMNSKSGPHIVLEIPKSVDLPPSPTFQRLVQVSERVRQLSRPTTWGSSGGEGGSESSSELSRTGSTRVPHLLVYRNRAYERDD